MTNPYLDAAGYRLHVPGVALGDQAIDEVLDAIADEIDDRFGTLAAVSEVLRPPNATDVLVLRRKPASIASVVERLDSSGSTRTLAVNDYALDGYIVRRVASGTNPATYWSTYGVVVSYLPRDDATRRIAAMVDAAKAELTHTGYDSETLGDYSYRKGGNVGSAGGSKAPTDRVKILREWLAPKRGMVVR